ncbi:MAG: hypothetical protein NTU74_01365 [Deltaproteobacteria bacterium]|nr:hypothetical protein [Deltaproteobacteria bacterium]
MVKKHYCMFWLCCLMIAAIAGCDSTNSVESDNMQLTIAANPTTLFNGEFSFITANLQIVNTTQATTGTTTTINPVVGYPVSFTISQNKSGSTLTVVNNLTDPSGNATAIYKSGLASGIDIVQASLDNGKSASVSIFVNMTPTPTPTATATPTPTPTATPTPTPTP